MKKYSVGIIGCGNISDIYIKNLSKLFPNINLIACSDIDMSKAKEKEKTYNIKTLSVEDLIKSTDIEIIVNLTTPDAHKEVCESVLLAGKHVYVEKPLALNKEDGKYLLSLAKSKNLILGCAPDTFLGGSIQTCIKLIHDGWIGEVIGCNAFMLIHGHESWHPDPEFYYKKGGGPMFDMGPYYLTAIVKMIGPISKVTSMTKKSFEKRKITSTKKYGQTIDVEIPTHLISLLEFEQGAIGQITTSFDVWGTQLPFIEVYGTKGSLSVPDPNQFSGKIKLCTKNDSEFKEIPTLYNFTDNSRGLGVFNMVSAINGEGKHETSGHLAYHILEIIESIHISAEQKKIIEIESRF